MLVPLDGLLPWNPVPGGRSIIMDKANSNEAQNPLSIMPYQEWYTLKEACALKNLNIKTSYNKRWLMPNKGNYEGSIGGRKCFSRATVISWLKMTDKDINNDNT
jgi:hypothetical protein